MQPKRTSPETTGVTAKAGEYVLSEVHNATLAFDSVDDHVPSLRERELTGWRSGTPSAYT